MVIFVLFFCMVGMPMTIIVVSNTVKCRAHYRILCLNLTYTLNQCLNVVTTRSRHNTFLVVNSPSGVNFSSLITIMDTA